MPDQEGDNKPKQTSSRKENKQKTTKLQSRARQERDRELSTSRVNLLGVFNAYVLVVGTVVGFGVLAYYTGHKITQDVIFYISIPLLLAIPIALICYWLTGIFKSTRTKTLLDRLAESAFVEFLARHMEVFGWFQYALSAWQIEEAVRLFEKHPRFSLATIVYFGAWAVESAIFNVKLKMERHQTEIEERLLDIIEGIETHEDSYDSKRLNATGE